MKKLIITLALCLFLTGCGNDVREEKADAGAQDGGKAQEETAEETEKDKEPEKETEAEKPEEKEEHEEPEEETEEEVGPEREEERETLAAESYEYDDGSKMTLLLSLDRNGGTHFTIGLEVEEKWKAAYLYTALEETIQLEAMQELNSMIVMTCGNDVITSYGISYDLSDSGEQSVDNTEWLAAGLADEDLDAGAADELVSKIMDDLIDFMSNQ